MVWYRPIGNALYNAWHNHKLARSALCLRYSRVQSIWNCRQQHGAWSGFEKFRYVAFQVISNFPRTECQVSCGCFQCVQYGESRGTRRPCGPSYLWPDYRHIGNVRATAVSVIGGLPVLIARIQSQTAIGVTNRSVRGLRDPSLPDSNPISRIYFARLMSPIPCSGGHKLK